MKGVGSCAVFLLLAQFWFDQMSKLLGGQQLHLIAPLFSNCITFSQIFSRLQLHFLM
jgi:hypothetical protein